MKTLPAGHPNRKTYNDIKRAADRLEKEVEAELSQTEAEITQAVEAVSSVELELENGERRLVTTDGRGRSILPRDLLNVWLVSKVFQGKLVLPEPKQEVLFELGIPEDNAPRAKKARKT